MYIDKAVGIRPIKDEDLQKLWSLVYKEENPEWNQWDAPYFKHRAVCFESFMEKRDSFVDSDSLWLITCNEEVCGVVTYYFEDVMKKWLEVGIVIHEGHNWNKGLGTRALSMWIEHVFSTVSTVRVGLTTWSGNDRMIRVADKLGMKLEGRIRKVRYFEGEYYDSIRMGILREEWENKKSGAESN